MNKTPSPAIKITSAAALLRCHNIQIFLAAQLACARVPACQFAIYFINHTTPMIIKAAFNAHQEILLFFTCSLAIVVVCSLIGR